MINARISVRSKKSENACLIRLSSRADLSLLSIAFLSVLETGTLFASGLEKFD
jgi:hypothetical protein